MRKFIACSGVAAALLAYFAAWWVITSPAHAQQVSLFDNAQQRTGGCVTVAEGAPGAGDFAVVEIVAPADRGLFLSYIYAPVATGTAGALSLSAISSWITESSADATPFLVFGSSVPTVRSGERGTVRQAVAFLVPTGNSSDPMTGVPPQLDPPIYLPKGQSLAVIGDDNVALTVSFCWYLADL